MRTTGHEHATADAPRRGVARELVAVDQDRDRADRDVVLFGGGGAAEAGTAHAATHAASTAATRERIRGIPPRDRRRPSRPRTDPTYTPAA